MDSQLQADELPMESITKLFIFRCRKLERQETQSMNWRRQMPVNTGLQYRASSPRAQSNGTIQDIEPLPAQMNESLENG